MNIDALTFLSITRQLLPPSMVLTLDDAQALVHTAQLAAGVDLDEDPDELRVARQLVRHICAVASIAPGNLSRVSPLPLDDEERRAWIARLVDQIQTRGVAELAYVIAYLVTVSDLELAPLDSAFVEDLRDGLGISRERACDLAVTVSSMITPGVESAAHA